MSKKNIKNLTIAGVVALVLIIGLGIFNLSKTFVLHGYSSGEIVLEDLEENSSTIQIGEDKIIASEVNEDSSSASIDTLYNEEGIILKCKDYLGSEYYDYETMFKKIVDGGDTYFLGLDKNIEFVIKEKDYPNGFVASTGLWGSEEVSSLDDYDFIKISSMDTGLKSVYFYDGNRVVYKLNTKEPSFFVVDYSNIIVDINMEMAEFGDVVDDEIYLIPKICKKETIEGYVVYFSYAKGISIEYNKD